MYKSKYSNDFISLHGKSIMTRNFWKIDKASLKCKSEKGLNSLLEVNSGKVGTNSKLVLIIRGEDQF